MKHAATGSKRSMFDVLLSSRSAQAAMMTLRPGQSSSEKIENEHPRCEQWLFVVAGSGRAAIGRRTIRLKRNTLLLIEKTEPHKITNTGRRQLVTLNIYVPPAYDADEQVRENAR